MKKFFKIFLCIVGVLVLLFLIFVAYELLSPSPREKIDTIMAEKLGFEVVQSVDQVKQTFIPLSYGLIVKKYSIFSGKKIPEWYILEPNVYKDTVSEFFDKQSPVDLDAQDAITFCPPVIYLKYWGKQRLPADYLGHSVHESFHALSCHSASQLPLPWEEGMTDYFTVKVLEDYIGRSAEPFMAFPYQVKVIKQLLNFIPENELLVIYMEKDVEHLKKKINEKFGPTTYDQLMTNMDEMFYKTTYTGGVKDDASADLILGRIKTLLNPTED